MAATSLSTKQDFDEFVKSDALTPYTWVYRWNSENEFQWDELPHISRAKDTLRYAMTPQANYFINIVNRHPSIVVYHKEIVSKVKHCHDKQHFHVISFHKDHPSNLHSFQMLKNILKNSVAKPYNMTAMKVFTPFGFCKYLTQDSTIRWVVCADNIQNEKQMAMLEQLTTKTFQPTEHSDNSDSESVKQTETIRGQKYDFIKKIMRKCNSTDLGDIINFCNTSPKQTYHNAWKNIYRNTSSLQTIVAAAATETNIDTLSTPIWEQIREKKNLFKCNRNNYHDIQTSLNIYEQWLKHHNINHEDFGRHTFEVCHKINPKINGLHITGVSNSGKSYVLRSIRNGLMNYGRMRCQASDNFTFGSCIDKTLIYTDEMWFTANNVEEAKCILEGTQTYINIKHRSKRILKRTPSLSTSITNPWRVVLQEEQALKNRMFIYETHQSMPQLKDWGKVELNPLMWLTIWKDYIEKYVNNSYSETCIENDGPATSTLFTASDTAICHRKRKRTSSLSKENCNTN